MKPYAEVLQDTLSVLELENSYTFTLLVEITVEFKRFELGLREKMNCVNCGLLDVLFVTIDFDVCIANT